MSVAKITPNKTKTTPFKTKTKLHLRVIHSKSKMYCVAIFLLFSPPTKSPSFPTTNQKTKKPKSGRTKLSTHHVRTHLGTLMVCGFARNFAGGEFGKSFFLN